jgi:hypothetical protein
MEGLASCPVAGFGVIGLEPTGSVTEEIGRENMAWIELAQNCVQ